MTSSPAVKALTHEIRREVIACLARGVDSPKDMAEEIGKPLGVVSYHVRMLVQYGVIETARTRQVRGALQHFYRFTDDAVEEFLTARDLVDAAILSARQPHVVAA